MASTCPLYSNSVSSSLIPEILPNLFSWYMDLSCWGSEAMAALRWNLVSWGTNKKGESKEKEKKFLKVQSAHARFAMGLLCGDWD